MIRRTLEQVAAMIEGAALSTGTESIGITGVGKDTRSLPAGCLYVPIIGDRFDGHDYVVEAMQKGAAGSLWQRNRGEPPTGVPVVLVDDSLTALQQLAAAYRKQLPVKVIGITGSNGKTSTKDMVAAVLGTKYTVLKTHGNLNNHIGLPMMLLELDEHTEIAVLEMGMSGFGEIRLLSLIASPDCAIITNIGDAHMLQLGSREGIAKAKFEIVEGLCESGTLIYHGDEPLLKRLVSHITQQRQLSFIQFGLNEDNDYSPAEMSISLEQSEFEAIVGDSRIERLAIPLLGRHNIVNALAAIAAGRLYELDDNQIRTGLASMKPTGMRIEAIVTERGATLLNDAYNASPTSMSAALRFLSEISASGRKIVVLGDMLELGESSEQFHRDIGDSILSEHIDYVYTYGELAACIAEQCASRFEQGRTAAFLDKAKLIDELSVLVKPGDIVLFKASRGMKLEQVVDAIRHL